MLYKVHLNKTFLGICATAVWIPGDEKYTEENKRKTFFFFVLAEKREKKGHVIAFCSSTIGWQNIY